MVSWLFRSGFFLKAELVIFCLSRMFLKMEDSSKAEQKHFVAFLKSYEAIGGFCEASEVDRRDAYP